MDSGEDGLEGKEMSKYPDLVKRLRENGTWTSDKVWESHPDCVEAADAIEHLMKEIDVLDDNWRKDKKQIEKFERIAQKQSDELNVLRGSIANYQVGVHEARIAELEAALKPLAEVAERYAYCKPRAEEDDVVMFELMYFNQARKVLGEKK